MELVRWNPHRSLFNFSDSFDRIFDDFFYPVLRGDEAESLWTWNPVVDIYDDKDHVVITAELPGVDKKDIVVDVKDRMLTLKGERSADNEVKEGDFYRKERYFGKFERTFTLPLDVDPDKISATYKEGVLKLEIPKPEDKKPKKITVH